MKNNQITKMNFAIDYFKVLKEDKFVMILEALVVSEGANRHNTYFSIDTINNAYLTIANKPILCIYDGVDFKEHARNMIDFKKQKFIGLIPESNKGKVLEIDGKKWQKVNIVIWKMYNPDIAKRLVDIQRDENGVKLSIEIDILKSHKREDGLLQIDEYSYCGICLLGVDQIEAIPGASASIIHYSSSNNKDISNINQAYFSLLQKPIKNKPIEEGGKNVKELFVLLSGLLKEGFSAYSCDQKYLYAKSENGKLYKYAYTKNDKNGKNEYSLDFTKGEELYSEDLINKQTNNSQNKFSVNEIKDLVNERDLANETKKKAEEKLFSVQKELDVFKEKEVKVKATKLYADNKDYLTDENKKELNSMLFSENDKLVENYNFNDFENKLNSIVVEKLKAKLYASNKSNQKDLDIDVYAINNKKIEKEKKDKQIIGNEMKAFLNSK